MSCICHFKFINSLFLDCLTILWTYFNHFSHCCSSGAWPQFVEHCWWFNCNWLSVSLEFNFQSHKIEIVFYPIQLHHSDISLALSITLFEVIYSFGVLFITCELGQRVNLAFNECNDMVEQFDWYSFPANVQRMLPLILHFMQQPIETKCFGSTTCDRETFKQVKHCNSISQAIRFIKCWKLDFEIFRWSTRRFHILPFYGKCTIELNLSTNEILFWSQFGFIEWHLKSGIFFCHQIWTKRKISSKLSSHFWKTWHPSPLFNSTLRF